MAIYGQDMDFTTALRQRQANKEQDFYGSLLSNAMRAGGQFDVEDGTAFYTGSPMQDKTESWNQFVQMKGGRISPADVQNFESAWKQANTMRSQQQIQELNRLRLRGFDDNDIRDTVEDSPELYGSLMDMVSNLESSGDENAMEQAAVVKQFLPGHDSDPFIQQLGEYIGDNPVMGPLSAYGAYTGGKYALDKWGAGLTAKLMGDPEAMKTFADYSKGKYERINGVWHYAKDYGKKAGEKIHLTNLKGNLDKLYNASNERSWKNLFKGRKMSGPGALLGYMVAEPLAEKIGGETAGDVVGTGLEAGLVAQGVRGLASGLMGKGWQGSLLAAGLLGGYGLYDRYWGDE